jgi:hypothetical protein
MGGGSEWHLLRKETNVPEHHYFRMDLSYYRAACQDKVISILDFE